MSIKSSDSSSVNPIVIKPSDTLGNVSFSAVEVKVAVTSLTVVPGSTIKTLYGTTSDIGKAQFGRADSLYKQFIDKHFPFIKRQICTLVRHRHITAVHLPFSLQSLFFNFVDEVIEHYQNQLEDKDAQINKRWLDVKRLLLKRGVGSWEDDDRKELHQFLKQISGNLKIEGALPEGFERIAAVWEEMVSIQFAGKAHLGCFLFDESVRNQKLLAEGNEITIYTTLSQADTSRAFFLALKQLQKDACWMLPEIIEKVLPINDAKLESDLKQFCAIDSAYASKSISELVQLVVERMKSMIKSISSVNLDDLLQVRNLYAKIMDINEVKERNCLRFCFMPTRDVIILKDGTFLKVSEEIRKHLANYEVAFHLQTYLNDYVSIFSYLLYGLHRAQYGWFECKQTGKLPSLASDPLLSLYQSREAAEAALLAEEEAEQKADPKSVEPSGDRNNRGKKKANQKSDHNEGKKDKRINEAPKANKNSKKNNPPNANKSGKSNPPPSKNCQHPPSQNLCPPPMTTSTVPTAVNAIVPIKQQDSILQLQDGLLKLYQENPNYVLRQILWYLAALKALRGSVSKTPMSAECLTLSNAVAYYSQKVLEQTYRFCTKKEGEPFTKKHNLREYHRESGSYNGTYPKVVNDLFLANNWCRYFYFDHYHWSWTSAMATTPTILNSLFHMAEGQVLSLEKLKKFIDLTIEDVCQQVEELLKNEKAPNSPSKVIQYNALELKETLSPDLFDKVSQQIENLLKSSNYNIHYPRLVHLSMKQALAAFSMLKVGLQKMNEAKDVRVFSTWTVCCLQQLQESMENVLHAIAYCENQEEISIEHEIKTLAGDLNLDIGTLGDEFEQLSYAMRYPVEYRAIKTKPMEIVGDLQNFIESPDLMEGFQSNQTSPLVWTQPSKGLSELREKNIKLDQNLVIGELIVKKFGSLLDECLEFLTSKALPSLEQKLIPQGE